MPNDRYVFTKIGYWPHLDVCVDCTIIWPRLRPGAEIRKKKKNWLISLRHLDSTLELCLTNLYK